jgi:hypothetical protein
VQSPSSLRTIAAWGKRLVVNRRHHYIWHYFVQRIDETAFWLIKPLVGSDGLSYPGKIGAKTLLYRAQGLSRSILLACLSLVSQIEVSPA